MLCLTVDLLLTLQVPEKFINVDNVGMASSCICITKPSRVVCICTMYIECVALQHLRCDKLKVLHVPPFRH